MEPWTLIGEFQSVDGIDITCINGSNDLLVTCFGKDGYRKLSKISAEKIISLMSFDKKCENPIFVNSVIANQVFIYFRDEFRKKRFLAFSIPDSRLILDVSLDSINLPKFLNYPRMFYSSLNGLSIINFERNDTLWMYNSHREYFPMYQIFEGRIQDADYLDEINIALVLKNDDNVTISTYNTKYNQINEVVQMNINKRLVNKKIIEDFRLSALNDSLICFWHINNKTVISSIYVIDVKSNGIINQFECPGQIQKIVMNNENVFVASVFMENIPVMETSENMNFLNLKAQIFKARITDFIPKF